jgi:glucose-1-phosphate cytidylyltransferase
MHVHQKHAEPWQITLIDTGENTGTGGRLKRVARYLEPSEPFCFTYGDGVSDIDLSSEIQFHKQNKKLVTLCAVQPPGRYGAIVTNEKNEIVRFQEKPVGDGGWINGGFFVMQPEAIEFIESDEDSWEFHVLPKIAARNQICAYEHRGFWHAMDTLRDKFNLEEMWKKGDAPWRIWK